MLPLGLLAPLYVATAGRALLAALSDADLNEYLARTTLEQQLSAALGQPIRIGALRAAIYPRVAAI